MVLIVGVMAVIVMTSYTSWIPDGVLVDLLEHTLRGCDSDEDTSSYKEWIKILKSEGEYDDYK